MKEFSHMLKSNLGSRRNKELMDSVEAYFADKDIDIKVMGVDSSDPEIGSFSMVMIKETLDPETISFICYKFGLTLIK